jgi:hypothetical protein
MKKVFVYLADEESSRNSNSLMRTSRDATDILGED